MKESFKKTERFQRRVIASFTKIQLGNIQEWWDFNTNLDRLDEAKDSDLKEFIDTREPDPKKALHLHYGISLLASIYGAGNKDFDGLHQALIWKTGPRDEDLTVEWKYHPSKFIAPSKSRSLEG